MKNNDLVKIIDYWQNSIQQNNLYPREIVDKIDLTSKEVIDIIGVRRSGKSSVLKLIIGKIGQKKDCLYINFEDPFFVKYDQAQIIEELIETYKEYFSTNLKYLFFDEIQNIKNWEKAIRKLRDGSKYKIFVTGSSSKLLSQELSTLLSGRHLSYQLFPLSYKEYLAFNNLTIDNKKDLILKEKKLLRLFDSYLAVGGFPEIAIGGKQELIKQYYADIIEKDIIRRFDIRQKDILEKMGIFIISNAAKIVSSASLKNTYKISFEMVSNYLEYLKESFLVFELPQFSYSLKSQQKSLKKFYAIDPGLANAVSFRFSEDKGRLLENCVFLELKRRKQEIYYYKTANGNEVDFLIKQGKSPLLIQVSWSLADNKTKQREIRSLVKAMKELKTNKAIILTYNSQGELKLNNKKISIMPVFKWLLPF